jgi:hypothetical protein
MLERYSKENNENIEEIHYIRNRSHLWRILFNNERPRIRRILVGPHRLFNYLHGVYYRGNRRRLIMDKQHPYLFEQCRVYLKHVHNKRYSVASFDRLKESQLEVLCEIAASWMEYSKEETFLGRWKYGVDQMYSNSRGATFEAPKQK